MLFPCSAQCHGSTTWGATHDVLVWRLRTSCRIFWRTARCRKAHLRQMAKRSSNPWNMMTCGKMLLLVSAVFMSGVLKNSKFLLVGENCYRYLGSTLPVRNPSEWWFYSFLMLFSTFQNDQKKQAIYGHIWPYMAIYGLMGKTVTVIKP